MFNLEKCLRPKYAVLTCTLLLAGCFGMRPAPTESPRVYLLEGQFESTGKIQNIPLTLLVSQPHAAPGFDTPSMAYVRHPHEIEYFTKNQWAEPPPKMLWPLLVSALAHETGYQAVVPAVGMVKGDVRLDLEINLLQQEFSVSPSRMHIQLRAQLVDQNTYRILATQTFDTFENAPSDDPYGGVIAANQALKTLMQQIANFVIANGADLAKQRK